MFSDEVGLLIDDPDRSDAEERFVLLGLSAALRVLVVVHSYDEDERSIRIISARTANGRERAAYAGLWEL